MITCDENYDLQECVGRIRQFKASDLVEKVSIMKKEKHGEGNEGYNVALLDFGYKKNIVRIEVLNYSFGFNSCIYICLISSANKDLQFIPVRNVVANFVNCF